MLIFSNWRAAGCIKNAWLSRLWILVLQTLKATKKDKSGYIVYTFVLINVHNSQPKLISENQTKQR